VAIDLRAGPSEMLVGGDRAADLEFVAADLLSQAETGLDGPVLLVAVDLTPDRLTTCKASSKPSTGKRAPYPEWIL